MSGAGTETCNGLDDDCDGSTDEGLNDLGACGVSTGECAPGRLQCIGALPTCVGGVGPTPETCNGLDDDCDTRNDERGATGLTDEGDSCGDEKALDSERQDSHAAAPVRVTLDVANGQIVGAQFAHGVPRPAHASPPAIRLDFEQNA